MELTLTHQATCAECQFDLEIVELDLVGHSVRITVKPCQHCQQKREFPEDAVPRHCTTCVDGEKLPLLAPCATCLAAKGFPNWRPKHARERLAHDADGDQRTEE